MSTISTVNAHLTQHNAIDSNTLRWKTKTEHLERNRKIKIIVAAAFLALSISIAVVGSILFPPWAFVPITAGAFILGGVVNPLAITTFFSTRYGNPEKAQEITEQLQHNSLSAFFVRADGAWGTTIDTQDLAKYGFIQDKEQEAVTKHVNNYWQLLQKRNSLMNSSSSDQLNSLIQLMKESETHWEQYRNEKIIPYLPRPIAG